MENLLNTSQEQNSKLSDSSKSMLTEELREEAERAYQEALEESRKLAQEEIGNQQRKNLSPLMKYSFILLLLILAEPISAQFEAGPIGPLYFLGQEFSKEVSLYSGKKFLMDEVLGVSEVILQFEIDALTAASSGELTTLVYQCQMIGKEGLILGFYGNYWNSEGVVYKGYAYKNLPKEMAVKFLMMISEAIDEHASYLDKEYDKNNVCFLYDDILILIYNDRSDGLLKLRLCWGDFDSEWTGTSFDKTKRRFQKYFVKKSTS